MLEIKPFEVPVPPGKAAALMAPAGAHVDIFKWLGVVTQIATAISSGHGSFVTWTPAGRKKITVEDA
ncbi:MAG: hypothetical protein H0U60_02340 [Blastocatellia bacterium]|nr:hypothetical protein [Blastocatellia bacterium]